MKDGIYFHLPEKKYHQLERMSASGIKNVLISLPTFWAGSWMNPHREEEEEDTNAQILGRAYHAAFFEPDTLDERFAGTPDLAEFGDDILLNDTAVKAALKDMGQAQTKAGELAIDRAYRLMDCGHTGPIKAVIQHEFEKSLGDRQPINREYWDQIQRDLARIRENPEIHDLLTGGAAEVTILWTDTASGIKMKARIDMLKPEMFIDLKSFANAMRKQVRRCYTDATNFNKYYLSMRFYQHAIVAIKDLDLPIQDSASLAHTGLIQQIKDRKSPMDAWLFFQEKGGIPNLLARKLRFYQHPKGVDEQSIGAEDHQISKGRSGLAIKADMEISHAIERFKQAMEIYGPDKPWYPFDMIGEISDDDFPPYFFEEVQI